MSSQTCVMLLLRSEYCWISQDSEPIKLLLKTPRSLSEMIFDYYSELHWLYTRYRVFSKSRQLAKFAGYFTWTFRRLFFGNYPPKNQNLMMSVFCSNTLIFAAKRWKCILRGPDFKIFPGGMPLNPPSNLHLWCLQVVPVVRVSSFSGYYKAFATYLKPYWKPCR